MAESVDGAFARANAEIARVRKTKPKSPDEARVRAAELSQLQEALLAASRKVVDAAAAKRVAASNDAKSAAAFSDATLHELARGLIGWIGPILKDVEKRLAAIEKHKGLAPLAARLTQMEMNSLRYDGVWAEAKTYTRGSFVTHAGSLWFAEDGSVGARPGAGSSAWKLAVKKGHAER